MSVLGKIFTWWDGATIGTALATWRTGVEAGRDGAGNVYYRSKDGKKRWVIYNGPAEASRVPPEWHLWLHKTVDTTPDEKPLPVKAWEKPWTPNATGTALAHMPSGALPMGGKRARATGDYEAWSPE